MGHERNPFESQFEVAHADGRGDSCLLSQARLLPAHQQQADHWRTAPHGRREPSPRKLQGGHHRQLQWIGRKRRQVRPTAGLLEPLGQGLGIRFFLPPQPAHLAIPAVDERVALLRPSAARV